MQIQKGDKTIVFGAGLVGSLLGLYLAKKGLKVEIYEKRADPRIHYNNELRSINLALSERGWTALKEVGLDQEVRERAVPMQGRMIHGIDGSETFQPYGAKGQAIYSVSRHNLNMILLQSAIDHPNVSIHFQHKHNRLDLKKNKAFVTTPDGEEKELDAVAFFGADGAFSAMRKEFVNQHLFNYEQHFLEHGYKEFNIEADVAGKWKLFPNALHIWPRKSFMMIALPNPDGSFTCTLFLTLKGPFSFESIHTNDQVEHLFANYFPDLVPLMPDYKQQYFTNPTSILLHLKCGPWSFGNAMLIGDAAHAIVPFYGQGMNAGFEDCRLLFETIEHGLTWETVFERFYLMRKADTDAILDLALENFVEMRDHVAKPEFIFMKKLEARLLEEFPEQYISLYSMVSFSNIPYSKAYALGKEQTKNLKKLIVAGLRKGLKANEDALDEWVQYVKARNMRAARRA
jgi:kynurenine 3-monooxygenase